MWLVVPRKLPLDIQKFEGKSGKDPREHVTTFHLWGSSNSLNHESIHLKPFQRTLTGPTMKSYIEILGGTYQTFNNLAMTFMNHFQLPVRYDVDTKLLLTFR